MEIKKQNEHSVAGPKPVKRVIRLEELDGDDDIVGGAGQKLLFGEQPESASPFAGLFGDAGKNTPPARGK